MADIYLRDVIIYDLWPGTPDPDLSEPTSGFDASAQCSSTPVWPLGTKIQKYNDSTYGPGYFTMIYLQYIETSDVGLDIGDPSTGYNACFHIQDACNNTPGNTVDYWYMVTIDVTNSDATQGGAIAFPAYDLSGNSTSEQNECGWFWCGGVNPCITTTGFKDCTRLAGEIRTDGSVQQGAYFGVLGDGTDVAALAGYDNSTNNVAAILGYALVADG